MAMLFFYFFYNYNQQSKRLIESENRKKEIIADQVRNLLLLFDQSNNEIEQRINEEVIEISNRLMAECNRDSSLFTTRDIDSFVLSHGVDTSILDVYFFNRDYKVFKSTYKKDIGLDFKSFGDRYIKFLDSVIELGVCYPERTSVELSTGIARKYSYHSTKNKKYILEMGYTAPAFSRMQNLLISRIDSISANFPEIKKISLFLGAEIFPTWDKKAVLKKEHQKTFIEVFKTGKSIELMEEENGSEITYTYIPIEMAGGMMHDGWVIQIISDDSKKKELLYNEVKNIIFLALLTLIPLLIVIYYGTGKITKPVKSLMEKVSIIRNGNLNERAEIIGSNEIAELSGHFNSMVGELEESYNNLDRKVKDRTKELQLQKEIVEEKQKEIVDSINYAKRIQDAILPDEKEFTAVFKEAFVLLKPKDIVSGDFYWITQKNEFVFYATADCTGHGVPGGFMSMLGSSFLNEIVMERNILEPAEILNELREKVISALKQSATLVKIKTEWTLFYRDIILKKMNWFILPLIMIFT